MFMKSRKKYVLHDIFEENEKNDNSINIKIFGDKFYNSQTEDEKVQLLNMFIENINKNMIINHEIMFTQILNLILPFTYPLQNEEIRKSSLTFLLKSSEFTTEKCILSDRIFDFCINSINGGFDDQYLKYIFATLANLIRNDIYHERLVEEVDPDIFCEALISETITEMNLKMLYILLQNIFKKNVSFIYAEIIAKAVDQSPPSNYRLSLIYTMVSQHKDIIYMFNYENLLNSITEQLKLATKEESLSAVCLLSLLIISDIKFTFDFSSLFDLTDNSDIQLKAAAFNCISYLALSNDENAHICLENNLFSVCEDNLAQDQPETLRKEAFRCILSMILSMTTTELENYLTPQIIEIMINYIDYDDDIELVKILLKAMNIILLPSFGPLYDALMNALEELNGWEKITELMNIDDVEKEEIKQLATIFYHNNHEELISLPDSEN